MRTVFFIPPLKKVSGGLASIVDLAGMLADRGYKVAAVSPLDDCPGMGLLAPGVTRLAWEASGKGSFLAPEDLWVVPDGWPNALAPGGLAGARMVMYVQNWAFMISSPPQGVRWSQLPLAYLAVSLPVQWFLREVLGLATAGVLPPSIRPEFFIRGVRPHNRIRIAWMPRKNKSLAGQIQNIAAERLLTAGKNIRTEYVEIHGRTPEEVAALLGGCHIFLSTGFPEGFGLPPLEAMASGCVPVGFSGLGGFEYMRNPEATPLPGLFMPPFPLEQKPWGPNGLFVSDGDVLSAGMALAYAIEEAHGQTNAWQQMAENARIAARAYSPETRRQLSADIWDRFARER